MGTRRCELLNLRIFNQSLDGPGTIDAVSRGRTASHLPWGSGKVMPVEAMEDTSPVHESAYAQSPTKQESLSAMREAPGLSHGEMSPTTIISRGGGNT